MTATYLSTDLLPASTFNRIRSFEAQVHNLSSDDLRALGKIFVATNMHHDWAAGILHRHQELHENSILVHYMKEDRDVCKAMPLDRQDRTRIGPNSFLLNADNKFQPYEHELDPRQRYLCDEFLRQIRELLVTRALGSIVAIIPNPGPNSGLRDEYQLPNGEGTICTPRARSEELGEISGQPVTTGWSFRGTDNGEIDVSVFRVCKVQPSGFHKGFPKPPPKKKE